jgi:hypothetical protein
VNKCCLTNYLILGHIVKLRHGDGDQVDALQVQDELMVVATSKDENYLLNCKLAIEVNKLEFF